MTGAFKTTPVDPLHHIAAIFPVKIQLQKLLGLYTDQVHCLLPTVQLRTIQHTNPVAVWPSWFPISTPISHLPAPSSDFGPFSFLAHPALCQWLYPQMVNGSGLLADRKGINVIQDRMRLPSYDMHQLHIHQLKTPSPPFAFAFLHYKQGRLLRSDVRHGVTKASGMIRALLTALTYDRFTSSIKIFLPAPLATFHPFRLSKHAGLSFSHVITHHLSTFLQADALHMVQVTRFSAKWSGLPGEDHLKRLMSLNQPLLFLTPPPTLLSRQKHALRAFYTWWEERNQTHKALSRIPPPSLNKLTPIPFIQGILRHTHSARPQHLYATGTWTFTGHDFTHRYSVRFQPMADDNIMCPCIALPPRYFTRHHILLQCPLHSTPC